MDLLIFALILLGVIVLIMFLQFVNAGREDRLYLQKLNSGFGSRDRTSYDRDRIASARGFYERHRSASALDDISWSDLSMDEIFAEADNTESDAGCQMLYHMLRNPLTDRDEIERRRNLIDFWRSESSIRNSILVYLHHTGRLSRGSVYDLLDSCRSLEKKSFRGYIFRIVLLVMTIILMFFQQGIGTVLFVLVFISNVYVYYRDRTAVLPHLKLFSYICSLIGSSSDICRIIDRSDNEILKRESERIKETLNSLSAVNRTGRLALSSEQGGNPFAVIFNILGIFVYADLIRFWKLRDRILEQENDIDRLIELTGSVDAMISAAAYIESFKGRLCRPVFDPDTGGSIRIRGVYHPLVTDAVPNDVDADRSILLTGANASGKSTFLRSIALGALFAQTFGYTCASGYQAPLISLVSAMSINDDVCGGDSYYMAEIKAVKRMMDMYLSDMEDKNRSRLLHVCFIDELLNGTNTEERIAACTQILKKMDSQGMRVMAATHDIELTGLLAGQYDNYHFEEDLSEGDVRFSYLLKTGPSKSRNAIKLLDRLGFDKELTEKAVDMVNRHVNDGIWADPS
ncbi:MAG: hypothetical protein IJ058_08270 [Lachnospiraceae bacterium]|nr:hypothetical protein [Lachnospiraceae bacterium]